MRFANFSRNVKDIYGGICFDYKVAKYLDSSLQIATKIFMLRGNIKLSINFRTYGSDRGHLSQ